MPMTWPNSPTVGQLHQPNGSTGPTYVFLGSKTWKSLGFGVGGNAVSVVLTGGQTVINALYQVGAMQLFRGGTLQRDTDDYTATNGTSITLVDPGVAGEVVTVVMNSILSSLDPSVKRRPAAAKTTAYLVTVADLATTILASGTWTLSLPPAASAGNGFIVSLKNIGTGIITIDPDSAETVNGVATIGAYRGDSVDLISDGTAWQALFQSPFSVISSGILGTAQATLDLKLPAEFKSFDFEADGVEPTATAALGIRLSVDGGSTFYSSNGAYAWFGGYDSNATTNTATYKSGGGSGAFQTTGIEVSPGTLGAASGAMSGLRAKINTRANGRYHQGLTFEHITGIAYYRGGGGLGINNADINAMRLLCSGAGSLASGMRHNLIGRRDF